MQLLPRNPNATRLAILNNKGASPDSSAARTHLITHLHPPSPGLSYPHTTLTQPHIPAASSPFIRPTTRATRRHHFCMAAATSTPPPATHLLSDAHCHPQLDTSHHSSIPNLKASRLAIMGVQFTDWDQVESAHSQAPHKTIPAFGIHPWWSHLHASQPNQHLSDVLEAKSEEQIKEAVEKLQAQATTLLPVEQWRPELLARLHKYPTAIVGEIGLDRAAVVPGTKASSAFSHQMDLFKQQLHIAAELGRPVSIHCVRAYGHLLQTFLGMKPEECPPKVMMHSYGGSVDDIGKLLKVKGVGGRFYFSFSAVINGRQLEKLMDRIRAVPDDRLLVESDEVVVGRMDGAMEEICGVVAEAKGWSRERVAEVTSENFAEFYGCG